MFIPKTATSTLQVCRVVRPFRHTRSCEYIAETAWLCLQLWFGNLEASHVIFRTWYFRAKVWRVPVMNPWGKKKTGRGKHAGWPPLSHPRMKITLPPE